MEWYWDEIIMKKVRGLAEHPGIGVPLSSVGDIQTDYGFLVCANHLIFYRCEDGVCFGDEDLVLP